MINPSLFQRGGSASPDRSRRDGFPTFKLIRDERVGRPAVRFCRFQLLAKAAQLPMEGNCGQPAKITARSWGTGLFTARHLHQFCLGLEPVRVSMFVSSVAGLVDLVSAYSDLLIRERARWGLLRRLGLFGSGSSRTNLDFGIRHFNSCDAQLRGGNSRTADLVQGV